jgi:hypothetical protein
MANISAHVRLRPIRYGFLVKPDDSKSLLEVFRLNTCLWGGKFNPIIPFIDAIPSWWDRHGHTFESASEVMNGYLDFFEPDFIVETESGLAEKLGFESSRVLAAADILSADNGKHFEGHGQNVFPLYKDQYHKVFQFSRRHPHDIVDVAAEDTSFALMVACLMGAFPAEEGFAYFGRAFTDAFEPTAITLTGTTMAALYEKRFTSALHLGHLDIDIDYLDGWRDPTMFVFDALAPSDLIDYWNLRAARSHVLPIPKQWVPQLSEFCKDTIAKTYRPLQGNPNGVMIRETVLFGRAIPTDEIEPLHKTYFSVDINGANVRQDWYPRLWGRPSSHGSRERRPILRASSKTFNSKTSTDTEVEFECLSPEWSDEFGSEYRWANVVKLRDWSFRDQAATVFPNDRSRAYLPWLGVGGTDRLSTTEGIVTFPRFKNSPEHWELPTGATAIAKWLKSASIDSVASDAGRATEQIIQALGGFGRVGDVARKGIIDTLDEMSRRPITRSAHHKKFKNQIDNALKGDIWGRNSFDTLVRKGAVELGLEVRCEHCASWSWYALNQLGYTLQCTLCLRHTSFPICDPGTSEHTRWAYRVVGPFALPDYAKGGYASALALRCLAEVIGHRADAHTTWCSGRELSLTSAHKVETDFIVWFQRKGFTSEDPVSVTDLVFGEAKSFSKDAFKAADISNLRAVARRFPGAVLVFATMKQPTELSAEEIALLRKVAIWGRKYRPDRRSRAPVVILTGIELFSGYSLKDAWKDLGGLHAAFATSGSLRLDNLRVLADATQQLYLALPSYSAWSQSRWDKVDARRNALTVAAQIPAQNS